MDTFVIDGGKPLIVKSRLRALKRVAVKALVACF